jgi:hypothetical protein
MREKTEKHMIATGFGMVGACMISAALRSDLLSVVVGLIGILLLAIGGLLEGGIDK